MRGKANPLGMGKGDSVMMAGQQAQRQSGLDWIRRAECCKMNLIECTSAREIESDRYIEIQVNEKGMVIKYR